MSKSESRKNQQPKHNLIKNTKEVSDDEPKMNIDRWQETKDNFESSSQGIQSQWTRD